MIEGLEEYIAQAMPQVGDYSISARASKPKHVLCDARAISRSDYADLFAVIGTAFGAGDGSTTFNVPDPQGRGLVFAGAGKVAESFAATAITIATDLITITANVDRWITGMKVQLTSTGTFPGGLVALTDYYVIRISDTTIKLAASLANAVAGTAVDITSTGNGTHTLTHSLTARAVGDKGGEEAHANTIAETPSHSHGVGRNNGGAMSGSNEPIPVSNLNNLVNTTATGGSGAHNNMPPFIVIGNLFIYAGV